MEQAIISGTLLTDVESCIDVKGRTYSRFTVTCGSRGVNGRTKYTHYQCTSYLSGYEKLKKGDQVFLSGNLSVTEYRDETGSTKTKLNILVYQMSGGYRAEEKMNR